METNPAKELGTGLFIFLGILLVLLAGAIVFVFSRAG